MQILINIDFNLFSRLFGGGDIDAADMLKACTAIRRGTPLPKGMPLQKGHWLLDKDSWVDVFPAVNGYRCSECNNLNIFAEQYCPSCGVKMESEVEE